MKTNERPDWCVEGAAVAEWNYRTDLVLTTIERFTKTQIVLANGSRYRFANMWDGRYSRRAGDSRTWLMLYPVHDERVQNALEKKRVRQVIQKVESHLREWKIAPNSVGPPLDIIAAINSLKDVQEANEEGAV